MNEFNYENYGQYFRPGWEYFKENLKNNSNLLYINQNVEISLEMMGNTAQIIFSAVKKQKGIYFHLPHTSMTALTV